MWDCKKAALCCLFGLLTMLQSAVAHAAEPSRQDLVVAERIARSFADGHSSAVYRYFSEPLRQRIDEERVRVLREGLERGAGPLRHVQAAYALPAPPGSPAASASVPLDFERGTFDLVLAWRGELGPDTVVGFTVRRGLERPRPGAPSISQADFEFTDANYVDRSKFREREVPIGAPAPIVARLVLPVDASGDSPRPAVLLLGDRLTDANGSVGPNRLLQDIAHGLGSNGVASIRFPYRRVADSGSVPARFTVEEELLSDARAALQALAATPGVDRRRIHVLGIGFGGYLAPELTREFPAIRGLVMLGVPARYDAAFEVRRLEERRRAHEEIPEDHLESLRAALVVLREENLPDGTRFHDAPAIYWYDLAKREPCEALAQWPGGVLYLAAQWESLLTDADPRYWRTCFGDGNHRRIAVLPGLNRWFLPSRYEGHAAEYRIPGHVAPELFREVIPFVRGRALFGPQEQARPRR